MSIVTTPNGPFVRAPITPRVLSWAIESGGFAREDVASVAGVSTEKVARWELGDETPTLNQLRKIAGKLKRPYPVFFLEHPPDEPQTLPDLRTEGSLPGGYSPELRLEIRRARYYQSRLTEVEPPLLAPCSLPRASTDENPAEVATLVRAWLGVPLDEQRGFRAEDRGFADWRGVFFRHSILTYVFRSERREGNEAPEALGFCLPHLVAPLIAVNGSDAPARKVFGLFHEIAHLVLGSSGVSDAEVQNRAFPSALETWCNHFANRCLLPKEQGLEEAFRRAIDRDDPLGAVAKMAVKLRVSRYVLLSRAREEGWLPNEVAESCCW